MTPVSTFRDQFANAMSTLMEQISDHFVAMGYEVAASWSDAGPEGRFDAVFIRRGAGPVRAPSGWAGAGSRPARAGESRAR